MIVKRQNAFLKGEGLLAQTWNAKFQFSALGNDTGQKSWVSNIENLGAKLPPGRCPVNSNLSYQQSVILSERSESKDLSVIDGE